MEMVDSLDEFKYSRSAAGKNFPNFEMLDAKIASAGAIGFSKRQTGPGKLDAKSWDHFEEYDSLSPRYVKQVSWKRKDHRLEKYKSKSLISEVPKL